MSGDAIQVHLITSPEKDSEFLSVPWEVYRSHPLWVPPLLHSIRRLLNPRKNPFWKRSHARFWVARKNQRSVGRIAAILNPAHNETWNEKAGFFGFFETIKDSAVSDALLSTAADWLRDRGATILYGPMNPSTNDECGILVKGFEEAPFIMMPYTPPYYPGLLENFGLKKGMDLFAYAFSPFTEFPPKVKRLATRVQKKYNVRLRNLNMKRFPDEVELLRTIYNRAWSSNWGFVPMTREEFQFTAAEFKPIAWPEFIMFGEVDGEAIGALVCIPDLNPLFKKMNGRLFPLGFRHLLGWRRKVGAIRLLTMGVLPEYRNRGVDAIFYQKLLQTGQEIGFTRESELGWVLENNEVMVNTIERIGGRRTKTLRIYQMLLYGARTKSAE